MTKNSISEQTENQALQIAKATQKPNQTKEQTKLIAKGIEKGITEYKKRQKAKARDLDKKRKKLDAKQESLALNENEHHDIAFSKKQRTMQASDTGSPHYYTSFAYIMLMITLAWIIFHMITVH
ncbi:MAG: hypothetical protein ACJAZB_001150 [Psychrosphaera sp.]|jgi:hypothetical protein